MFGLYVVFARQKDELGTLVTEHKQAEKLTRVFVNPPKIVHFIRLYQFFGDHFFQG